MKKVFTIVVCAMLTIAASAQSSFFSSEKSDKPISFGVRVGGNISTITGDVEGAKSRFGFNAGVSMDVPFLKSLYLETGLYLTQKGCKFEFEEEIGDEEIGNYVEVEKWKANPLYIEIPVLASYRYDFNDDIQLRVNAGPYIAYGISGKDGDDKFFSGDYAHKRFDMGLQVGTGISVSKFYVGCAYEFGLTKVNKEGDGSVKNGNFMFNAGYNF